MSAETESPCLITSCRRKWWEAHYRQWFSRPFDFSDLTIPTEQLGFSRVIVMAQGVSLDEMYRANGQIYPVQKLSRESLDVTVISNERDAAHSHYVIRVRNRQEPDENLYGMSALQIQSARISTETLGERLMHELSYHAECGQHLDRQNLTLCAGSRYFDGTVPTVDWDPGTVRRRKRLPSLAIGYADVDDADPSLAARQVFSL